MDKVLSSPRRLRFQGVTRIKRIPIVFRRSEIHLPRCFYEVEII